MASSPEGLAKHRLRSRYLEFRQGQAFAGEALLWEMGRIAWAAARQEQAPAQLVALTLAFVLCDAAARMEGREIDEAAAQRWFGTIDQTIVRCVDALMDEHDRSAYAALTALARAYAIVSAQISN